MFRYEFQGWKGLIIIEEFLSCARCSPRRPFCETMVKLVLVASYLFCMLGLIAAKPLAVVHIGPHKAASTYIQSTLSNKAAKLAEHGLYWPNTTTGVPMVHKGIADFAMSLRSERIHNANDSSRKYMVGFVEESLRLQRNIFISSEEFGQLETEGVKVLFSILSGFEVRLVYIYREFLSHIVSHHFEENRFEHNIPYSEPFSEFLFRKMDSGGGSTVLHPVEHIAHYATVFGNDSLHIIDLAGCAARRKDVAYVVYCEIAGAMCEDESALLGPGNVGFSLVVAELFSHYRVYTETQRDFQCRFCETPLHEYQYFVQQYGTFLLAPANKLPVLTSKLGMLVPYAEQVDRELRIAYGTHVLYGNQSANFAAMRSDVHTSQLNGASFTRSSEWTRWLRKAYRAAKTEKRLCGCD